MPSISRKRFLLSHDLGRKLHARRSVFYPGRKSNRTLKTYRNTKQTRRVGNHRYVPAGERKEYYLQVIFENGTRKKLPVSLSTYNNTRTNATRTLTLEKGFFGYTIIKKGI